MISALYVDTMGPYFGVKGVDPWDALRDARKYNGPHSVVAHPPCERWGRYWSGGPSAKVRRLKGDDLGCFDRALWAVRTFGGVIEHPAHSAAWDYYGLVKPAGSGWNIGHNGVVVCEIAQGHYGHPAEKLTWLYIVFKKEINLPAAKWGRCQGKRRLDEGFHSKEERRAARSAGKAPIKRLTQKENSQTPVAFRDFLIEIARRANG